MQLKSIQLKITVWAGACLMLASAIYIGYSAYTARSLAIETAQEQVVYVAQTEAAKVKAQFEDAMTAVRTLAETLRRIKDKDNPLQLDRATVNAMLRSVSEDNPQFVGVYTLWEPNAFDGRDAAFVNAKGHDATGRFLPYWEKNQQGRPQLTPLVDYDKDGPGDYYQVPKRTMRQSVVGPYEYPVAGKIVLMDSFVQPIVVEGRFYGITGVNLLLNFVQAAVDKVNLYEHAGRLMIVNSNGVLSALTGRPDAGNKQLADVVPEMAEVLPAVKAGQQAVVLTSEYLKVAVPMPIGRTASPWAACVLVPRAQIVAAANASALRQALIGLVLLAVAVAVLWYLAGRLAEPIKAAANFADQLAAGLMAEKVPVTTADETGRLLTSMNSMLESTNTLVQSRADRDHIQQSIMRLLEQVGGVAQGDLTRRAEVTADITGAIADSFNFMIAELRRIIGKVQDVTLQVNETAGQTQQTAQRLAFGAEQQAEQIQSAAEAVDVMAFSIQRVAESATLSAQVAQQSLHNARLGAAAVQTTIRGMAGLREQVQETAKRIKRLAENSQEIGEVVQLIRDIAYRTSVLALNASIQAARAGDAGRGFAVVAEEVERLAKRSSEATKRITGLVKTIQTGTNEAITAMEGSTREVVEGSSLVLQAGHALNEIETVSTRLAELIQSISQVTEQQAKDSEVVSKTMVAISDGTHQTTLGMKQSAISATQLTELADELRASVASFKLAETGHYH